jgi:hypothetical protein
MLIPDIVDARFRKIVKSTKMKLGRSFGGSEVAFPFSADLIKDDIK